LSVLAALSRYWSCRLGATAIEYALIAGLVALLLVPGLLWLRDRQEQLAQHLNHHVDPTAAAAALIDARRDFREAPRDARDHQGR
jgi:Flp pilus assembly pilin Flp